MDIKPLKYIQITELEYKALKESDSQLSEVLLDMGEMSKEIAVLRDEVVYLRGQIKMVREGARHG